MPGCYAVVLVCLLGGAAVAQVAPPPDFATAVTRGTPALELRYRWENVDQDSFAETANASTLRLRLNYGTLPYRGFSGFVEFDYVAELLVDDYNSGGGTSPGRTQYPVVADPDGADLNQLFVDFDGLAGTAMRVGRQRILLDNQRFIGNVGWRQNEQTYDGVTLRYNGIEKTAVLYSYLTRVNRIFGDASPSGRSDSNTHLLNARILLSTEWTLSTYLYRIDDEDTPTFSTMTLGARVAGRIPIGERNLSMSAEFASQSDAANAPVGFRAEYYRIDATLPFTDRIAASVGYELLGGDRNSGGQSFRTPLATLHAFQGWADQFLATPDAGVADLFIKVTADPGVWRLAAAWHRFSAADGPGDWGSELDLSVGRKIGKRYGLLLKAAIFDADSPAFDDTRKIWLMLSASY